MDSGLYEFLATRFRDRMRSQPDDNGVIILDSPPIKTTVFMDKLSRTLIVESMEVIVVKNEAGLLESFAMENLESLYGVYSLRGGDTLVLRSSFGIQDSNISSLLQLLLTECHNPEAFARFKEYLERPKKILKSNN